MLERVARRSNSTTNVRIPDERSKKCKKRLIAFFTKSPGSSQYTPPSHTYLPPEVVNVIDLSGYHTIARDLFPTMQPPVNLAPGGERVGRAFSFYLSGGRLRLCLRRVSRASPFGSAVPFNRRSVYPAHVRGHCVLPWCAIHPSTFPSARVHLYIFTELQWRFRRVHPRVLRL